MQNHQMSKTSLGTAFMRAYHAAHDQPLIFNDFLAQHMISAEEYRESAARHLRAFHKFHPDKAKTYTDPKLALTYWMQHSGAPSIVLSRASYAEEHLEQAVAAGVKQYVILGAGMDTFALRRPDLMEHVFEVDHPATQAAKRQRLSAAGQRLPDRLHFLPVDFSQDNLAEALRTSAYDPQTPSFFSWMGVTYYLTRAALDTTFAAIAASAPAGSAIIFDYLDAEAFIPGKAAARVQVLQEIVRRVGEPMITGFDPATLAAELERLGLCLVEDLDPTAIQQRFFAGRPDGYHACEQTHFARAVVA